MSRKTREDKDLLEPIDGFYQIPRTSSISQQVGRSSRKPKGGYCSQDTSSSEEEESFQRNERLQVMYDVKSKCFVLLDESTVEKKRQLWTKYQEITNSKKQESKLGENTGNMSPWKNVILPPRNSPRHARGSFEESNHSFSSTSQLPQEQAQSPQQEEQSITTADSQALEKNQVVESNKESKEDISSTEQETSLEQNKFEKNEREVTSADKTVEKPTDHGVIRSIRPVNLTPWTKFEAAVVVMKYVRKYMKQTSTDKDALKTEVPEVRTTIYQQIVAKDTKPAETAPQTQVPQQNPDGKVEVEKKATGPGKTDSTSDTLQSSESAENIEHITCIPSDPVLGTKVAELVQKEESTPANPFNTTIERSTTPTEPTPTATTTTTISEIELPKSPRKGSMGRMGSARQTPRGSMSRLGSFQSHMKAPSPEKAEAEAYERSRVYWAGDPVEVSVICSAKDDSRRRQNRYFNPLEQEEPLLGDQTYQNMRVYDVHQLRRINRHADGLHRANINSGTLVSSPSSSESSSYSSSSSSSPSSSEEEYQEEKYHVGDRVVFKATVKQDQKKHKSRQQRRGYKMLRGEILCRFRQQISRHTRYLYQIKAIDDDQVFEYVSSVNIVGLEEDDEEEEEEEKFFEKGERVEWYEPNTNKTYLAKVICIHSSSNRYDIQTRTGRIVEKVPSILLEYAQRLVW